jgi:LPS O-antigen subunit length determinant protein (WzzB/FepE family)
MNDITFKNLIKALEGSKSVLVFYLVLAAICSSLLFLMEDKYRASIKVSPIEGSASNSLSSLAGQLSGFGVGDIGSSTTPQVYIEALEIIKSRSFLYEFIEKNNLNLSNENIEDFYLRFLKNNLRTFKDRQTNFLTISIISNNPADAYNLLIKLKEDLQEYVRLKDIKDAERNIDGAINEIPKVNNLDAREAISNFIQNQVAKLLFAKNSKDYVFKVIENPVLPQKKDSPSRALLSAIFLLFAVIIWLIHVMFAIYVFNKFPKVNFSKNFPFLKFSIIKNIP